MNKIKGKTTKKKIIKRVCISIPLIAVLSFIIICSPICNERASHYTEEEHLQRISKRIQKRYIDGDDTIQRVKATGFSVYPLYDENECFQYVLVEFQPVGYLFVHIMDERQRGLSWLGMRGSIYTLSSLGGESWPHRLEGSSDYSAEEIRQYIDSPYSVRGVGNERRYLIPISKSGEYIPAVKKSEWVYVNLLTNKEFELRDGEYSEPQETIWIPFINKKYFDL